MTLVTCLCGVQIEGANAASLNDAYWAHTDGQHGEFKISAARRQNATDALLRTGGWDGERAVLDADVEIRPLAPALRDDYLRYFDTDAFPDNPAWASCYCISYNIDMKPEDFEERSAAENRAEKSRMIDSGAATGVMAYSGGRVVGWCNAGPRTSLPLLDKYPEFAAEDPATAGAIVCFVIAPPYRGQGLARRLLDGACEMLRDRGLTSVYAYPPKRAASDAGSYHGKLSMYLDTGFEETGAATSRYVVVRRALT
jgi:GNAT superfamily N-acetyltransferase